MSKYIFWIQTVVLIPIVIISCTKSPVKQPSPKTIVDLAGYSLALDECKAQGKDAGAYSVYEECAKKADAKYGRDAGQ